MTSPTRYFMDQDSSCHWHLIEYARRAEWLVWRDLPDDDPRGWEPPAFAKRIDDVTMIHFTDPQS